MLNQSAPACRPRRAQVTKGKCATSYLLVLLERWFGCPALSDATSPDAFDKYCEERDVALLDVEWMSMTKPEARIDAHSIVMNRRSGGFS